MTGDSKTDKTLKKDACLIMHNDSLYINCRGLTCQGVVFGNWYAPAYVFDRDYPHFIAPSIEHGVRNNISSLLRPIRRTCRGLEAILTQLLTSSTPGTDVDGAHRPR